LSILGFSQLKAWLSEEKRIGVFTDTTILFSATFPSDPFNEESEAVFDTLADAAVSPFVSVNVRAEFLENHRRASFADCLVDFLNDLKDDLDGPLLLKLQSHRKLHRQKADEGKNTRLDVNQIKNWRTLLKNHAVRDKNGWDLLCRTYLKKQLATEWANAEKELSLNFISTRVDDYSPLLNSQPSWERVIDLMGDYGLASADAMILNMFLCSKIPALLTSDRELAEVADQEAKGQKKIFVPSSLLAAQT